MFLAIEIIFMKECASVKRLHLWPEHTMMVDGEGLSKQTGGWSAWQEACLCKVGCESE